VDTRMTVSHKMSPYISVSN